MDTLLEGIQVVELAARGVGPIAGLILTQLGANVIKIESPVNGDPTRRYDGPGMKVKQGGHSIQFEFTNRNKKSVTIDLNHQTGKEIGYRLIEKSDVFISNYLPRSLNKLGFDYNTLKKYNPKLVFVSSNAYGSRGPDNEKSVVDPLALTRSGLPMASGQLGDPPTEIRGTIADCLAGTFVAWEAVAGLLARERQGIGQEIESSILGALIWLQQANVSQVLWGDREMGRESSLGGENPLNNNYMCKDKRWIKLLVAIDKKGAIWQDFCRLTDNQSLENDPRFENERKRRENKDELITILKKTFSTKNRDEWIDHFNSNKALFQYEGFREVNEIPYDPQVIANNYVIEEDHPILGNVKSLRFPVKFSQTPSRDTLKPAPELGEHTEEILLGLGYVHSEIVNFRNNHIIL